MPAQPMPGYPMSVPSENSADDPLPNSPVDDFFVKINHDFRRPRPSEEAVAAALEHDSEAAAGTEDSSADGFPNQAVGELCPKCRAVNSGSNRFCGFCGALLIRREKPAAHTAAPPSSLIQEQQIREQP